MEKRLKQVLIISGVLAIYILVLIFYLLGPFTVALENIARFFGLFGLLSLLISSIMAAFTRDIYKIFGKPFKKVHHFIALFGLGVTIMHPILLASAYNDISIFVPNFSSWNIFWELAGRPALYLIVLAVLAGFLQSRIPKWWRYIHAFNYVAVIFGVVHGMLIGGNLSTSIALKIIYGTLLVLTAFSFSLKRYKIHMKNKRLKTKQKKSSKIEE